MRAGHPLVYGGKKRVKGFPVGDLGYREFVFTEVILTGTIMYRETSVHRSPFVDDDDAAQSANDLGTIELRVERVVQTKSSTNNQGPDLFPDDGPLQEKSKKLGGHRIG